MDSLSNFPEFVAMGAPLLLAGIALIGTVVWLTRMLRRKQGDR